MTHDELITGTAEVIRTLRTQQQLTQQQLAIKSFVSDDTVRKMEKGRSCSVTLLKRIAAGLGYKLSSFMLLVEKETEKKAES